MLFSHKQPKHPPVTLVILDGWGEAPAWGGNAPAAARLPTLSSLYKTGFHTTLEASGAAVGLPGNEQGNSEVGHLTIGSGRAIVQDRTRITNAINDGSFFRNKVLIEAMQRVTATHKTLHLIGLVSDGGVHSHMDHLHALLEMAKDRGCMNVAIHAITDGRDTPPQSAAQYLDRVRHWCEVLGVGKITSIVGRYYAMDRDNHWDRVEPAYRLFTEGVQPHYTSILAAIGAAYTQKLTDEFIPPMWIESGFNPIQTGDSVVLFNFRQDRSRQLLTCFADSAFNAFPRKIVDDLYLATMIPYWIDKEHPNVHPVFVPEVGQDTLGDVISQANLRQMRIAESEKYAHVTYFLNGGHEAVDPGEDRKLIPSKITESPALHPAMHTIEIGRAVISAVKSKKYACVVANIASPDMVGHTGNFPATVTACEVVDQTLSQILAATRSHKSVLVITADHGNCEELVNPATGEPDTQHTRNPVLLVIDDPTGKLKFLSYPEQTLADVAPTILTILGLPVPHSMTGHSLAKIEGNYGDK